MAENTQSSDGAGWATVAAIISGLTSAYSANQLAEGQEQAIGSTNALMGRSRQDAMDLFARGGERGRQGLMAAMDFYGDGARERMMPMTLGNVAAQGVAQQGGIQANNAIMGLPVDMSYANPQQITPGALPSPSGMVGGGLSAQMPTPNAPNTQVPNSPTPAPQPNNTGPMGGLMGTIGAAQQYANRPEGAGMPREDGEEREGEGLMSRVGNWISEYWDDALGAAAGFAYGGPVGAQLGARGANWLRNVIQGRVSIQEVGPGETLPPYQPNQPNQPNQPQGNGSDPVAAPGVDMGASGQQTTEDQAPAVPVTPNNQWERASELAQGGLQREAQNQEMMASNFEATMGAGSRGQNVGNAYSASANRAAAAAESWLQNQYSWAPDNPNYGLIVNYLVPWLMGQVRAGMSYEDALNTVTPNVIERRIAEAKQGGA